MRKLLLAILPLICCDAASSHAATLRVLTYNIHLGALGTDGQRSLSRIADVINAANPDIVALQEVDKNVPRSGNVNQMSQLAALTGMQSYFGKTRNLNGGEYGNGILVRNGIDIVSTTNHQLPNPDVVEARAVIEMNLSLDSNSNTTEFKFFATHLMHNSSAGRIASAHFINDLVSGSSVPAILAGDMNYNPGSTAFNVAANQWTDLTNVNNSGKNRSNQIDYVFYRGAEWEEVAKSQFILNALTNVASDHDPLLGVLELPVVVATNFVWNVSTGVATGFSEGFAFSNGSQAVGAFPVNPWEGNGGQQLFIGFNGNATISGSASRTIGRLRIGTNLASPIIAGRNGNGTATISNSVSLTAATTTEGSGDVIVGEGGFTGLLNWNSTGTLEAQGKLRIGQGGVGTLNQSAGTVIGGNAPGSFMFVGVGVDAGSTGTYNLNGGFLKPSGGFTGTEYRQTLVGDNSGAGALNVGDDVGDDDTAVVQSNDDLIIGRNGGSAVMTVRNDGRVELQSNLNPAELVVGENGQGSVVQTGGTVTSDDVVRIGGGASGVGTYAISGGVLATATDGSGTFQIARGGAGTLRVSGTGSVTHGAELYVAHEEGAGTGRLELIGGSASIQIGQLENAVGKNETIAWQAADSGVTPLVVSGVGPAAAHVQLQDPAEAAANTGFGATLSGDGIALSLDLSALSTSQTLTLIDNRSTQAITGFFENGASGTLYAEGAEIAGSGFNGSVTISYLGSSGIGSPGNDVVLNLVAAVLENPDFDGDGDVDGADFLTWQRGVGLTAGGAQEQGDANGDGAVDADDLLIWQGQFRGGAANSAAGAVPEPASCLIVAMGFLACGLAKTAAAGRR